MVHPQDKTDLVAIFQPKRSHSGYVSYVFAAGYLLCPILMEYENSGDFTVAARLRFSLRRNAVPGCHVLRGISEAVIFKESMEFRLQCQWVLLHLS